MSTNILRRRDLCICEKRFPGNRLAHENDSKELDIMSLTIS